jgi:hypothetical protein
VGSNPALIPGVKEQLSGLPFTTSVEASTLGRAATVMGATHIAATTGLQALLASVGAQVSDGADRT